ncbi:hypothetical protein HMPREF1345_02602 [Enterococcus faecium TX1337RF]|nr:hypothetical protein HMPREF1345_02602 [Enterococcus faecium TX1337RF]
MYVQYSQLVREIRQSVCIYKIFLPLLLPFHSLFSLFFFIL